MSRLSALSSGSGSFLSTSRSFPKLSSRPSASHAQKYTLKKPWTLIRRIPSPHDSSLYDLFAARHPFFFTNPKNQILPLCDCSASFACACVRVRDRLSYRRATRPRLASALPHPHTRARPCLLLRCRRR